MSRFKSLFKSSAARRARRCEDAWISHLRRFGALTLEEYMVHCLVDARFGYYRRARLGEDFTTAPMLSNALGLVVGGWLVERWRLWGCPREIMLVEVGSGRGDLLGDVLGVVLRTAPEMLGALSVHVVDINEAGRRRVRKRVRRVLSRGGALSANVSVAFYDKLEVVPRGRWFFLANEFFDALPVRQYLCRGGASHMRRIALDEREGGVGLRFVQGEPCLLPAGLNLPSSLTEQQQEGRLVEVSPRALFTASLVAGVLGEYGGAAWICDYGYLSRADAPKGGSLQAFYRHKAVDPLTHIGACDLSAEVDFEALLQIFSTAVEQEKKDEVAGCRVQTQGSFLQEGGIERKAHTAVAQRVVRRLVGKRAMGEKFKVLTAWALPRKNAR